MSAANAHAASGFDSEQSIENARLRGLAAGQGGRPQQGHLAEEKRARAELRAGRYEAARVRFRDILKRSPHHLSSLINLGSVYVHLHRNGEAIEALYHAIALNGKAHPAWINLTQALLGEHAWQQAYDTVQQAITLFGVSAQLRSIRGDALKGLGKFERALEDLDFAVREEPDNPVHRIRRGGCLVNLNRYREAMADFERLTESERQQTCVNMGLAYLRTGDAHRSLPYFDRAIELKQEVEIAWSNKSTAFIHLGEWAKAYEALSKAIEIDPKRADFFFNMSLLLLRVGEYDQGLEMYEWRLRRPPQSNMARITSAPRWDGKASLSGKTLFVRLEQGAGDMIQMVRYLPALMDHGATVALESHVALKPLLVSLDARLVLVDPGKRPANFDVWIELMSLPYLAGTRPDDIPLADKPYLSANVALAADWRARLAQTAPTGARHLGFVWQGNQDHANDENRSLDNVRRLAPLLSIPGTHWHCLQIKVGEQDRAWLAAQPNVTLWGEALADYGQTAAIIQNLEALITVDTSVAHVAGAIGKPTWVLLAKGPDWRWGVTFDSGPWYACTRLFRQPAYRDWETVIDDVRKALMAQGTAMNTRDGAAESPPPPAAVSPPHPCKVCGGATSLYGVVDFNKSCEERNGLYLPLTGVPIYYRQCRDCRLIFTEAFDEWNPRDFKANIYNEDYAAVDPDYRDKRPRGCAQTVAALARRLHAQHLFDYGAGAGLMARLLREQGFSCEAWDPFDAAANTPRDPPRAGASAAGRAHPESGRYDLVSAFEVLEHTPTPEKTVAELLGFASPEGIVVFSTLAVDALPPRSVGFWYIAPRNGHVTIYTKTALERLFSAFGWKLHHFSEDLHVAYRGTLNLG